MHSRTQLGDVSKQVVLDGSETLQVNRGSIPAPSQDSVLRLLDTEISQINSDEQSGGWNSWALLGALSAVLWLILDLLGSAPVELVSTGKWVIVLASLRDLVVGIFGGSSRDSGASTGIRFRAAQGIQAHWRSLLSDVLRAALLLGTAWLSDDKVPWLSLVVAYVLFSGSFIFNGGILALSRTELPLPTKHTPAEKLFPAFLIFLSLLRLLVCYGFFVSLRPLDASGIPELRLGILIIAASEMLRLLLERTGEPPLLSRLVEIRRNLALGKLSPQEAASSAEIALLGLQLDDVLQEDLQPVISAQQELESYTKLLEQTITNVVAELEIIRELPAEAEEQREQRLQAVKTHLHSGSELLKTAKSKDVLLAKSIEPLNKRLLWLYAGAPDVSSDVKEIAERTGSSLARSKKHLQELMQQFETLAASIPNRGPD